MQTKELLQIENLEANLLPELQGWTEKQEQLVDDNPFLMIVDNKTYEEAKRRRTALVSGRTAIEKQDKLIASKLKNFRGKVSEASQQLILISLPFETKQQEEVKRWEAIKEQERQEKLRIEEERKLKIQTHISSLFLEWKKAIENLTFDKIESFNMYQTLNDIDTSIFEEFELDFAEKKQVLETLLTHKVNDLKQKEALRVEEQKQAQERERLEKEKEAQAKKEAELAERERKVQEAEEKKSEEIRLAKEQEEREKLAKQKADELEALKPDIEKLQLIIEAIGICNGPNIQSMKSEKAANFLLNINAQISELKNDLNDQLKSIQNI